MLGPRDGRVVVLVHGFPFDRRMWRFQATKLANAGWRVVVPDLFGFGQSEGTGRPSMEAHADDLARLLDQLHVAKAIVAGFSMGGYVALAFAERHADRLDGLVLIDTRAEADTPEGKGKRDAVIVEVLGKGVRPLAMRQMASQFTEATRKNQRLLAEEVRDLMLSQAKAGVVAALQAMRDRPDRRPVLLALQAPCLVLVGEQDAVTPLVAAQAMAEAARAPLRVIAGAAHLSPMEKPQDVNAALLDWLAALPSPTSP